VNKRWTEVADAYAGNAIDAQPGADNIITMNVTVDAGVIIIAAATDTSADSWRHHHQSSPRKTK